MIPGEHIIIPDWPAPPNVRALSTTRLGGVSTGSYESLNLGDRCGDDAESVHANRAALDAMLPAQPLWLNQVHGTTVLDADEAENDLIEADAAVTSRGGTVLSILTADCLPVLFCDEEGTRIGAAHAGWRGMAEGVIEATVAAMGVPTEKLLAWLGPAIGQAAYEVGQDVYEAFSREAGPDLADAFRPSDNAHHTGKWQLDLAGAARLILARLGVERVSGGNLCTHSDPTRFFSHRRDGVEGRQTGRQASLVWLA